MRPMGIGFFQGVFYIYDIYARADHADPLPPSHAQDAHAQAAQDPSESIRTHQAHTTVDMVASN